MFNGLLVLLVLSVIGSEPPVSLSQSVPLSAKQGESPQVEALLHCRESRDESARLACFDRAVEALRLAQEAGTVAFVNPEAAQRRRQRRFGLAPSTAASAPAIDVAQVQEVQSTVRSATAATGQPGRWNLLLDNGMVWQTVEPLARLPRDGAAATIKAVRLGGYRMAVEGRSRSYAVKRIR